MGEQKERRRKLGTKGHIIIPGRGRKKGV